MQGYVYKLYSRLASAGEGNLMCRYPLRAGLSQVSFLSIDVGHLINSK